MGAALLMVPPKVVVMVLEGPWIGTARPLVVGRWFCHRKLARL